MQYRSDSKFFYLMGTPFEKKDFIKENLGGHWTKKGWRFPKNVHAMREVLKAFPSLKHNEEFVKDGKAKANELTFWKDVKNETAAISGLRPYQAQDTQFLRARGSSLVLNEPRTGKTPTMIKTLVALEPKSSIIVAPSSLTYNWSKEIEKWAPDFFHVTVYSGTPKVREKLLKAHLTKVHPHKIIIVSKDTLKLDEAIRDLVYSVAIIDEAHFLRNYKTAQSKAIFKLTAFTKYALTGTPAVKHGADVYGLLHFIDPEAFPSYWQFADRYWSILDNGWGKDIGDLKKHRQQELVDLMEVNSVQRKRKDVMQWLPKAQHETIYVQMGKKQEKYYNDMLETYMTTDEELEHEVDTLNQLSQLMRLRQLCLDPRLLDFKEVGAKTEALLEFAENNPEPFLVMTMFSSYFDLIKPELEKLGKKVGVIDGSVSQSKKFATADKFQNGEYDILLCNIIAAGTGFTLDRADTIVFLDKDFNPANNEQAQDRIVPTTESRFHPINIISIVCDGTVDSRIHEILERKEDLTKIINKRELLV